MSFTTVYVCMYVIGLGSMFGQSHDVEVFEIFKLEATVYSKLCHVTFLNLLLFRVKQRQFYQGLVSSGNCYSFLT